MAMLFQIVFGLQNLWFVMALVGSFSATLYFMPRGKYRLARLALWMSCIGCTLLTIINVVGIFAGGGPMTLLLAGLWGYMTYRDITMLSMLS